MDPPASNTLSRADAIARARAVLARAGLDPGDADVQLALAQLHPHPVLGPSQTAGSTTELSSAPLSGATAGTTRPTTAPSSTAPAAQQTLSGSLAPALDGQTAAAVGLRNYSPARAHRWDADELRVNPNANKCTRQLRCAGIIEHPLGAVVEYPETGAILGEAIAHRFPINPASDYRPQHSFQYSLSDDERHGSTKAVDCLLVVEGEKVKCKSVEYGCGCLRMCTFQGSGGHSQATHELEGHCFTSPAHQVPLRAQNHSAAVESASLAEVEVFRRTLAFYCGIVKHGCSLTRDPAYSGALDDDSGDSDGGSDCEPQSSSFRDIRSQLRRDCAGSIKIKRNVHGHSYLECEHRSKGDPNHLILRNLQDLQIPYLRALLEGDSATVRTHEQRAAALGVGPLVPCRHSRSPRSQAELCPHWHRDEGGKLAPGIMSRSHQCAAQFRIFEPHDLHRYPFILVVCTGPHSHPPPERSKTPALLRDALRGLLIDMRWQLADATPRRIMQDAGFVTNLRHLLEWDSNSPADPTLADLHPSLGNLDHLEYLIEAVRNPIFPNGTDFEGACKLRDEHANLPPHHQYVRYAEEMTLPGAKKKDRMVICMLPSQSKRLLDAKRLEVDISFKRVTSWYEYEMVTWDNETSQSITLCRAFLTSMCAEAHLALYREIFRIAEHDTGRTPRFLHLHGDGFETWTADDDKGHALGLGMYLQEISRALKSWDKYEPTKRLCDLSPYDHLARFLRLCIVHFKRNIKSLQHRVSSTVYDAMWSLAASETHLNFDAACEQIRRGGKAAANWLKEKELFALAALYQPRSKIPLDIWLAGNATTNGVEQKHRDIYRDGKALTLLGGINRGLQHDLREHMQVLLVQNEGIDRRYTVADHGFRQYRRIHRSVQAEKRKIAPSDPSTLPKAKRSLPTATASLSASAQVSSLPSYLTTTPVPAQPAPSTQIVSGFPTPVPGAAEVEVPPEHLADYEFLCTLSGI